jgi:nucleotide-binding universal stress UspA family protein
MYKKIMVPLDGSELAECVLPHVETFIAGCQVSTIVFIRVIKRGQMTFGGSYATTQAGIMTIEANAKRIEDERKSSAEEYLKEVVSRIKQDGGKLQTEVVAGKVADTLVDYTEANNIDLILIATHGRSGVSRWVRGSIADRILRAASVPVLMVRAPGTMSERKD